MATIKNIILFALAAVMMAGCEGVKTTRSEETGLYVIDSCEYIMCPVYAGYVYTHHNNCKFCKERREKELEELVKRIKE